MIGIADTAEDMERRNCEGFPIVEANVPANRGNFHQQVDQSRGKNDALPWVSFSWLLSGLALGCVIVMAILMPRIIDSKVAEGVATVKSEIAQKVAEGIAQARVDMAQQVAQSQATANAGREHARIALSEVERANAELAAKKLINPASH